MNKKKRNIIAAIILVIIAAFVYFSYNPEESNIFPPCPFHYATGLDCPGCGSQRAIHHLLHFEVGKAFLRNPLLVLFIPFLIVGSYLEYFGGKQKHPRMRQFFLGKNACIIIFILVVTYWIGRNVIKFI